MDYLFSIMDKIFYIIILLGCGVLAKKRRWVSDQGEKDISNLVMDFVWPCLIFSSIVTSLTAADILANLWLPVLSIVMHGAGLLLGLAVSRLMGYYGERQRIFLFHSAMNNFFLMALPFAEFFFPDKGAALLAVANLGSMISLWVLGPLIMTGNLGLRQTLVNIFSPGLIATLAGIVFALAGWGRFIPDLIMRSIQTAGQPTLFLGLMVAGFQIYKLGRQALKFDAWNLLVGLLRNIVVPLLMLPLALALRGHIGDDSLAVFMLISVTPASVNSVTMALKFNSSPRLAAEGVLFTHLLAVGTMVALVALTEWAFLAS